MAFRSSFEVILRALPRTPLTSLRWLSVPLVAFSTWIMSRSIVRLLYSTDVELIATRIFRSRDEFPVSFYLDLVSPVALNFSVIAALLAGIALVRKGATSDPSRAKLSTRGAILLSLVFWAGAGLFARRVIPWSFQRNDDAVMMAVVSGAFGGQPDPVTGFLHTGIGQVLVLLYGTFPRVPWYGLLAVVLQVVALSIVSGVLLRSWSHQAAGVHLVALSAVGGYGTFLVAHPQFTQVAATLMLAALALAVVGVDRRSVIVGLVVLSAMIRLEAMLAVLLVAGFVLLPQAILDAKRGEIARILRGGMAAVLVAAAAGFLVGLGPVERALSGYSDDAWRTELHPRTAGFGEPQQSSWQQVAEDRYGPLSDNDRRLISAWVYPSEALFGTAPDSSGRTAPMTGSGDVTAKSPLRDLVRTPGTFGLSAVLLALGVLLLPRPCLSKAGTSWSASRFIHCRWPILSAFSVTGLIGVLSVTSRAPLRVAVPLLLAGATLLPLAAPPVVARSRVVVAAAVAISVMTGSLTLLGEHQSTRRSQELRATWSELMEAAPTGDTTVLLWLSPFLERVDPLSPQVLPEGVNGVEIAGWASVLPSHHRNLSDRGLVDWVEALQERDDVVLIGRERYVETLSGFVFERRTTGCLRPLTLARSGSITIVSGFLESVEVAC